MTPINTEQERETRRNLAVLKEQISMFLYNNFINFERDKRIQLNGSEIRPNFFLNDHEIFIDCFRFAVDGNADYEERKKLYEEAEVKHLFMDFRNLAEKNVDEFLKVKLPNLGCELKRK
ncbi:hypothetical protein JW756_03495 [Candidatus Woesearchaeota archaeon]|nr:hypothetical protein [Candidatus Woesearchaeota archaeon]